MSAAYHDQPETQEYGFDDLSPEERAEYEAHFAAQDEADDRLPNPEDFGLPAGTPDPFRGSAA